MKRQYDPTRIYARALLAIAGASIIGWFIQHQVFGMAARIVGAIAK